MPYYIFDTLYRIVISEHATYRSADRTIYRQSLNRERFVVKGGL